MKYLLLKVFVSRFPYFTYGISEDNKLYTFVNNSSWVKVSDTININIDDLTLIDENVFHVTD